MQRHMDVVGVDEYGNPVVGYPGSVMGGDVMGYGPMGVVGHDEYGNPVVGRRAHPHHTGVRTLPIPPRPQWRDGQLAPGVIQPDEGMVPLPLSPVNGSTGTFSATVTQITFQGQLQKPYRGERLLVSSVRTGTSSTGRLLGQLFVGTDLQQGDIQSWDIELVGQSTAFGTRLTMKPAIAGVLIRMLVTLSSALAGSDTIFASLLLMGRIVH